MAFGAPWPQYRLGMVKIMLVSLYGHRYRLLLHAVWPGHKPLELGEHCLGFLTGDELRAVFGDTSSISPKLEGFWIARAPGWIRRAVQEYN
jgi:hypothetical protein